MFDRFHFLPPGVIETQSEPGLGGPVQSITRLKMSRNTQKLMVRIYHEILQPFRLDFYVRHHGYDFCLPAISVVMFQAVPPYSTFILRRSGRENLDAQARSASDSGHNLGIEKISGRLRRDTVFLAVKENRAPRMPAPFHTEAGFEIEPIVESSFLNKLLKGLDNVVVSLNVTGTADTDA